MLRPFLVLGLSLTLLAACSDGGSGEPLTDSEYAAEFQRIAEEMAERTNEVSLPDELQSPDLDERREAAADFFQELGELLDDGIAEIADLEPPDKAQENHDAVVSALRSIRGTYDDLADEARGASGEDDFVATFATVVAEPLADFDHACDELASDFRDTADRAAVEAGCRAGE